MSAVRASLEAARSALFRQLRDPRVIVNFGSFAVMGVCGILLHIVVATWWGSATLGVFNQVFGAYLLAGQFAVLGLHNAALRYSAARRDILPSIALASLGLCLVPATVAALVFWFARDAVGGVLDSEAVARGMALAAPGVFLFAINKVALALLNGANQMVPYGLLQALRFVMIVSLLAAAAFAGVEGEDLAFALTGAELAVSIVALPLIASFGAPDFSIARKWLRELLRFGLRSFPATSLSEANLRVDVLVLGLFASDVAVGIYALASTITEGLLQLLIIIRALATPAIVEALETSREGAHRLVRQIRKYSYALMVPACLLAAAAFPIFLKLAGLEDFSASVPIFVVLQIGLAAAAGYLPIGTILMLGGHPGDQSVYSMIVIGANLCANLVLSSLFGAMGAAIATAGAMAFSALLLQVFMTGRLGLGR